MARFRYSFSRVSSILTAAVWLALGSASALQATGREGDGAAQFEARMEELRTRLALSDDQVSAVGPIVRDSMEKRRAKMSEAGLGGDERPSMRELRRLRGELDDIREATEERLADVLSESQLDTYRTIQEEWAEEMRERMKAKRGL